MQTQAKTRLCETKCSCKECVTKEGRQGLFLSVLCAGEPQGTGEKVGENEAAGERKEEE